MPDWGSAQARSKWTFSSFSMSRSALCAARNWSAVMPFMSWWTSMNLVMARTSFFLFLFPFLFLASPLMLRPHGRTGDSAVR